MEEELEDMRILDACELWAYTALLNVAIHSKYPGYESKPLLLNSSLFLPEALGVETASASGCSFHIDTHSDARVPPAWQHKQAPPLCRQVALRYQACMPLSSCISLALFWKNTQLLDS